MLTEAQISRAGAASASALIIFQEEIDMRDLCPEERMLSYSKYFYMEMSKPDPVAMQVLNSGPLPYELTLRFEDKMDLFRPGYLPAEQGYSILPDGGGYIANYVKMPGVTVEMIDWWFIWHFIAPPSVPKGNGNLRYKIWCPKEHWDTGTKTPEDLAQYLDESLPMRERRYGPTNFIVESVDGTGENLMQIEAQSFPPEVFGLDVNFLNRPGIGTVLTAYIAVGSPNVGIHYYRPIPGGVELRTRYWMGYELKDAKLIRKLDGPQPTEELVRQFTLHNMTEYPHLAKFLPSLYAEEGNKPLNAY